VNNKRVATYKKAMEKLMPLYTGKFKAMVEGMTAPYKIGFYFVRDSHRAFDYNNASQVLLDLMQPQKPKKNELPKPAWLSNDDTKNCVPVFLGTHVDPSSPGVYITIVPEQEWKGLLDKIIQVN
jgi:hypothetical protein